MTLAYHFVGKTLRDGQPIPADGEWLAHDGECVICESTAQPAVVADLDASPLND